MKLNAYLTFDGRCEEAFKFYEKVLGGKIGAMIPHEGSPASESVSPEWRSKILHARLNLGDQVLMGSDAPPESSHPCHYREPQGFSVCLHVRDIAEAERVFGALSEGGKVKMPIGEIFFAARFGTLVDRYGIPWMIICEKAAA